MKFDNLDFFIKNNKLFYPLGKISKIIFSIQLLILRLLNFFFITRRKQMQFELIKGNKVFVGEINNNESYIIITEKLSPKLLLKSNNIASLYLGGSCKANSPRIISTDFTNDKLIKIKIEFIFGTKEKYSCLQNIHYKILADLYNNGSLIDYNTRLKSSFSNLNGKKIRQGVVHGDFTPFNIIITKDSYSLIDWEKSSFGGPILYDLVYYYISNSVLFGIPFTINVLISSIYKFLFEIKLSVTTNFIITDLNNIYSFMKLNKVDEKISFLWLETINNIGEKDFNIT